MALSVRFSIAYYVAISKGESLNRACAQFVGRSPIRIDASDRTDSLYKCCNFVNQS